MSRIIKKFEELQTKNEKALIAYLMVGYPSEKATISSIRGLIKGGTDIIEIGFPFSDPLADGPVIQNASTISLRNGTKIENFFKLVKKIRKETELPLVLMTYTNILFRQGFSRFISKAKKAGIDAFILPDMSVEESDDYIKAAKNMNEETIFLVSPNTNKKRIKKIAKISSGFLYLIGVYGTTGVRTDIKKYTIKAIKEIKNIVKKEIPVGVGFGVSTPEDVKRYVSLGADAVIVGSAFIRLIEKTPQSRLEQKISTFAKKLKKQTKIR